MDCSKRIKKTTALGNSIITILALLVYNEQCVGYEYMISRWTYRLKFLSRFSSLQTAQCFTTLVTFTHSHTHIHTLMADASYKR